MHTSRRPPRINFPLLYVHDPIASADFYAGLLDCQPVESSPTFAMFVFSPGVRLGLWSRHTVEPSVSALGVAGEVVFAVEAKPQVDALFQAWTNRGIAVIQTPVELDFGYTFVALDPDGHRLRVYVASAV